MSRFLGDRINVWQGGSAVLIISLAIVSFQVVYAKNHQPNPAQDYLQQGINHSEQGEYFKAIEDYSEAIALESRNALTYYNRGVALTHLQAYEAAIADYTQALNLKSDFVAAYKNRGLARIQAKGQLQEAIADYDRAIQLDGGDAGAYLGKGLALAVQGDRRLALKQLTQAIKLEPPLAIAYFVRGSVYLDLEEKASALADYQQAAQLYQQQQDLSAYRDTLGVIDELN